MKTLQDSGTAQAYFRSLDTFVQEKEHEIERICNENYEDFASAIGMLGTVRQGTGHLKGQIGQLDGQLGQVGQELSSKVSTAITSLLGTSGAKGILPLETSLVTA